MYVTKNLYEGYATFIDVPDHEFFHHAIQAAIVRLQEGHMDLLDVDKIKQELTPVVYCSSVISKTKDDDIIARTELNQRSTKKYLIIDVDYNIGEEDESNRVRNRLLELSEELKCKLILYPTVSYPLKPRFRAVLFANRSMGDVAYHQAITWLYEQLGVDATDKNDFRVTTNHNLPVFTNDNQLDAIYDNTENDEYGLLDNALWKLYPKIKSNRSKKKQFVPAKSKYDDVKLGRFHVIQGAKLLAKESEMLDYSYFWKIVHSVARAEIMEQITNELALTLMDIFASATTDEATKNEWEYSNRLEYNKTLNSLRGNEERLYKAKPLFSYDEWKQYVKFEGDN